MREPVLILDFGSQVTQLIARRIRELGVYSEIKPCNISPKDYDVNPIQAVILSGGPSSVTDSDAPPFDPGWLSIGKPILGICYGMQLIGHLLGGKLGRGESREYGRAPLSITDTSDLFSGFDKNQSITTWMSHGDHVDILPIGFDLIAESKGAPIAAMADRKRKIYALQFHPEVAHTDRGKDIIGNFLFKISNCKQNWNSADFIESTVARIHDEVGPTQNVICALSGGVDSTVAAVLVSKAIGNRLHCIFVDNGLLRHEEAKQVAARLGKEGLGLNLSVINAGERFLKELSGVTDPEMKRKIIGRVFIEIFEEESKKIPNVTYLVQGTLYPDVIESIPIRGHSATIKTHHNVGGLPERMNLKLIEPFRELFKDEVRKVGADLNVPDEIINRQPFPGPGLAVRVLGEITQPRLDILKKADKIFVEEIRAAGLYKSIWQSFAVLLPIQSVGVMGDGRTYEQTIALRAVYSDDGMTADWCYLPEELLRKTSSRIINEVKGVNRVVMDISSKPPSTIEWE